jgi:hypothetical protein
MWPREESAWKSAARSVTGRRTCLLLALGPLALAGWATGSLANRSLRVRASDPPVLVPWTRVGNIWLGESRTRVEATYGRVKHDALGNLFYPLHGSKVAITYGDGFYRDAGDVRSIEITTPYYRTRAGFGVGSTIPLGPCHRVAGNRCEHLWHGFIYGPYLKERRCACWVKVGVGPRSLLPVGRNFTKSWFFIYVSHGRVREFYFSAHYID